MNELSLREWMERDRVRAAPSFFARPAWALALAHEYPSLVPSVLLASNGVAIPTMRTARTRVCFRDHVAFPLGGYSVFLAEDNTAADSQRATHALAEAARALHHLRIAPWPLGPLPQSPARTAIREYETAVIDCSRGFDAAVAGVRGVTRRMAGQAERRGVVCERAAAAEIGTYYQILGEASVGWGLARPPISRRLLEAVFRYGGDDAQLWLARVDGTTVGGGVVLFGSEELFFWSAAMRRDFARHRPSNALNMRLIHLACERGVRWYNLGASEGLEGVARFKSDLGARSVSYPEFTSRHPAYVWYERVREGVSSRVFSRRSA